MTDKRIVAWGTGGYSTNYMNRVKDKRIEFFIDNNMKKMELNFLVSQ